MDVHSRLLHTTFTRSLHTIARSTRCLPLLPPARTPVQHEVPLDALGSLGVKVEQVPARMGASRRASCSGRRGMAKVWTLRDNRAAAGH